LLRKIKSRTAASIQERRSQSTKHQTRNGNDWCLEVYVSSLDFTRLAAKRLLRELPRGKFLRRVARKLSRRRRIA
jgi:hypothetical protein